MSRITKIAFTFLLVLGLAVSVNACGESDPQAKPAGGETTEAAEVQEIGVVGSKVVDFTLTTYEGEEFTAGDLEGKVTLLTFWFPT